MERAEAEAVSRTRGEIAEQVECFDRVDRLREAAAEAKRRKREAAGGAKTARPTVGTATRSDSDGDDSGDDVDELVNWRSKKL